MSDKLNSLLNEIRILEKSVEEELLSAKVKVGLSAHEGKIFFSKDLLKIHRSFRKGVIRYLFESDFLFILSAPVIYSLILPAIALDVFCFIYQAICFPIYRIPKVDRKDYIRLDRHKLAYLNGIEKLNCEFCAYFNGSLAYAREIASRTEQYWCPIRHAFSVKGSHNRYNRFFVYGDADAYSRKLKQIRRELQEERTSSENLLSK